MEDKLVNNSKFVLPNYTPIHQPRANVDHASGGVCIFVHNSINFKPRADLNVNNSDCESLNIEIINKATKNIIVNTMYRQPAGDLKAFKNHLSTFFANVNKTSKHVYIAGDLNMNLFYYSENDKVKHFVDKIIQNNFVPTITRATRVTTKTATLIDNILTNNFVNTNLETGVIQTDLTDHFPTYLCTNNLTNTTQEENTTVYKRDINESSISYFRNLLIEMYWEPVLGISDTNRAYELFLKLFSKQYDQAFPVKEIKIKTKSLKSPWITKGLLKSSKKKQQLYEKFLKRRTFRNEQKYKDYKNLFEKIKNISKKSYYQDLIAKNKGNSKKTWDVIKEIIGKNKSANQNSFD